MKLINIDVAKGYFLNDGGQHPTKTMWQYGAIAKELDRIPAIEAIPIDEILKLRDKLFEANQIGFEGFSKINQLITQYSTYKYDIFNTDEVSK